MEAKLTKVYYSPQCYWRGMAAIKNLAEALKVTEETTKQWLIKQALWQIYIPAPCYIPHPKFDVSLPNEVHQAILLFYHTTDPPRDCKVYKYTVSVVEVATFTTQARFKCVPTFCGSIIIHIFMLLFFLIEYSTFTDQLLSEQHERKRFDVRCDTFVLF